MSKQGMLTAVTKTIPNFKNINKINVIIVQYLLKNKRYLFEIKLS